MNRPIIGFHRDEESHWLAALSCGHGRHTRHDPPLSNRPWVLTAAGRASQIGSELDCVRCDRSEMPDGLAAYHRTAEFDETSIPAALREAHSTKRGVWGLIHVRLGRLEYFVHSPHEKRETLTSTSPGIVVPEVLHHVRPAGPVKFFVEFWRSGAHPRRPDRDEPPAEPVR
jgi:tellurite resistance-related uncharacterized protein